MAQRPKSAYGNETATTTAEYQLHDLWRFAPRRFRIDNAEEGASRRRAAGMDARIP